jgi:hypothetical protein
MPQNKINDLMRKMAVIQNDIVWLKRIIVGAAGLGFLEKIIGWVR